MSNDARGARETSEVTLPCASATEIEQGDECYWDATNSLVKPLSGQTDQGDEPSNQVEAAENYLGRAASPAPNGITTVNVDFGRRVTVSKATVPSGTYRFGSLLGPSENSGGDGLLDQQLEAVTLLEEATHVVMDDDSSSRESVLCTPIKTFALPKAGSQGIIPVPLGSITHEDGQAMTAQATTVAGYTQLSNKELVIEIPVNCNDGESLGFTVPTPPNLDASKDVTLHVVAGKDADNDALTLDAEVYSFQPGDVGNDDAQDTAAQTVTQAPVELVFTCGADDILGAPGGLSAVLALGGTNDGDAMYIYAVWFEYSKKQSA